MTVAAITKFPSGFLGVRRTLATVTCRFYAATGTVAGAGIVGLYNLPLGFRMVALIAGRGPIGSTIDFRTRRSALPHSLYSDGTQLTVGATSASCNYLQGIWRPMPS